MLNLGLNLGQVTLARGQGGGVVLPPSGFDWSVPFGVRRRGSGFDVDVTPDTYRPEPGATTLYVSPTGNNANSGATALLAKRSIANAYNSGATTIIVAPGDYTRQNGFEGLTLANRDITIINSDPGAGKVIIGRWEPPTSLTWTQNATYPNVYSATRSTAVAVRDRSISDADGNIARLTPRASVADVAANPGSQYITGSTVNVSLADGRAPDSNVLVFLSGNNGLLSSSMAGRTFWVGEGVEFWGGDSAFATTGLLSSDTSRLVCDGTIFRYATNQNGLSVSNLFQAFLFACRAEANHLDGFNYHYAAGGVGYALEVDCIGRSNGYTGGSNNGSTNHEDGRIVRVGGLYIGNEGPQVVDIDTSQSWNLGCRASGGDVNYRTLNTAEMWLDTCVSDDATTDLDVGVGSTIYTRQLTSGGVFIGSPTPY